MMESDTVLVILNPTAGRKRAAKRWQTYLEASNRKWNVQETQHRGHARELARRAALDGVGCVAAAGGDGTVHEVACGILDSQASESTLGVIPIGSANDFAWSVQRSFGATRPTIDVGRVRSACGKQDYFVESLGTGLSGHVTIQSRRIPWLQGMPLYTLATLRALWEFRPLPLRVSVDAQSDVYPTLLLSILLGKREGSFLLAPDAQQDDGWFDVVHARRIHRWQALGLLPRIGLFGTPRNHPEIAIQRCRKVQIESPEPLAIHIDGELFSVPDDRMQALEVEILPARLQVEVFAI